MQISREHIVEKIKRTFENDPAVYACWLEGSDGTNSLDEHSDLDFVLDVEDGNEEDTLSKFETILCGIGPLDLNYEAEQPHPKLRYKIFHIAGTPAALLLDVTIQSHSRDFEFVIENKAEVPKVIFDKCGIIRFHRLDKTEFEKELQERIYHLVNTFLQQTRAKKYAVRNQFLEALAYYQKFVLHPLVELLRIRYSPINYDYFLVHISRDMPHEVLMQLENLYKINTTETITRNIETANTLFWDTLDDIKQNGIRFTSV